MLDFNHRNPSERLTHLMDCAIQEENARQKHRDYLGASMLGDECLRKIVFSYFGAPKDRTFSGRILRVFQRGHTGEAMMIDWLRMAGFDLRTEGADGKQFGFMIKPGGIKISGHCDGIIMDGPEDLGPYPMLWECKTLSSKSIAKYYKGGVAKASPLYAAQVALYQHYFELHNPALFTALNADTMDVYAEKVEFNAHLAQNTIDRAVAAIGYIQSGEVPPAITRSPLDFYVCKWCDYQERCNRLTQAGM